MDVVTVVKRSPVVFPLACIAAVALIVISEGSYWQSINGLQDLTGGRDASERILGLERSLLRTGAGNQHDLAARAVGPRLAEESPCERQRDGRRSAS